MNNMSDFEIENDILLKYVGNDKIVEIPTGVKCIEYDSFHRNESIEKVVIPNGVTKIGAFAFAACENLKSVTIPNSVIEIDNCAFGWSKKLESIVIPEGVIEIGERVFCYCINLKSITIPNSLVKFGKYSLEDCYSLKTINAGINNKYYTSGKDDNVLIEKSTGTLIFGTDESTIPDSIKIIGENAFSNCKELENVLIPDSVVEIGQGAFCGCDNLKSIRMSNNVTEIKDDTFNGCINLESFVIPNSVVNIGEKAFNKCEKLNSIEIPNSVVKIDDYAFSNTSIDYFFIPKTVKEIGYESFGNASVITLYDNISVFCSYTNLVNKIVNVLRVDNDELKYRVNVEYDGTINHQFVITNAWKRDGTYDFALADEYFDNIRSANVKLITAISRVFNPYDLQEEYKEKFIRYIVRNGKKIVKIFIDSNNLDSIIDFEEYGILKKTNIKELIEYSISKGETKITEYLMDYDNKNFKHKNK